MTDNEQFASWTAIMFVAWIFGASRGADAALYGGIVLGLFWLLYFIFWLSGRK